MASCYDDMLNVNVCYKCSVRSPDDQVAKIPFFIYLNSELANTCEYEESSIGFLEISTFKTVLGIKYISRVHLKTGVPFENIADTARSNCVNTFALSFFNYKLNNKSKKYNLTNFLTEKILVADCNFEYNTIYK
ncbi:hypothetical protein KOM00_20340 [Geomonas sp. Red69]|uniref:hypothetical protein n=1 Tax=Geomonas diazotrophica TaxID=2843197 RepID=UPI001C100E96|nr:hypothetical protein [Geomonas diazotrophica]MBU5639075.1 hypothetical protein [Geomonas diazotrophica]